MKILEVEINNYRQYRGQNIVKLSTDSKKNITIIQGDNGSGKSNFMNAITWCLYDDEMFKSKTNEGRKIVNESALFDADGKEVEVSVIIELGETTSEYRFKRYIIYALDRGRPYTVKSGFQCQQIDPDKGWIRRDNPDFIVDRVFIKSSLRSFFFFDGEKMDKYFEDTSRIKTNVEQIAQIDLIDDVLKTLKEVNNDFLKDKKKIGPVTRQFQDDPSDIQEQIYEFEKRKMELEEERDKVRRSVDEIDQYLKEHSNELVKQLQTTRKTKEVLRTNYNKQLDEAKKNLRDLISSSVSLVYGYTAMKQSYEMIEEGTKKGELPPNIKDVFVRELLDRGKCICGRDLKEDAESRRHVEELLERIVPDSIAQDSVTGKYVIGNLMAKTNFNSKYIQFRTTIRELKKNLDDVSEDLESISEQLATFDEIEISEKEEERRTLNIKRDQLSTRIGTTGNQIVSLTNKKEEMEDYFSKLDKTDKQIEKLNQLTKFVDGLIIDVTDIRNSIVEEVRSKLEEKTREYFFRMIWKKDAFSDVRIIDLGKEYRISVLSDKGQECLGDISAGERQVLALSFTAALYLVSGFSAPVFIDTPLGRISGQPRINVAENLPSYLSETQVVILPTDTEYTPEVRERLLPSVGHEYKIRYNSEEKVSEVVDYE